MNQIGDSRQRQTRIALKAFRTIYTASLFLAGGTLFAQQQFHDWTAVYSGGTFTYKNVSAAGTVIASSPYWGAATSSLSLPAITTTVITTGFNVGTPGSTLDFQFSPNYGWGQGGQMIIGNIHNCFEYTITAWDANNNLIDVNQWQTIADYPYGWSPASKTSRASAGLSGKFFVLDPGNNPNWGQGGVLWVGGLKNVAKLRLTLSNNNLAPNGHGSDYIAFNFATPQRIVEHCTKPAIRYDGAPVSASWDSMNCYIKPIVKDATPFIWNNAYYVAADKSTQCVQGAGSYDGANCYFMPKPAGAFIVNDSLYVPPGSGNSCSMGSYDGTGCLVKKAPWATHAFEWDNTWYFTPLFTCKDGSYDGANCFIMTPPTGTTAFIWANNFYYAE